MGGIVDRFTAFITADVRGFENWALAFATDSQLREVDGRVYRLLPALYVSDHVADYGAAELHVLEHGRPDPYFGRVAALRVVDIGGGRLQVTVSFVSDRPELRPFYEAFVVGICEAYGVALPAVVDADGGESGPAGLSDTDRRIVDLWREDYTAQDIADRVGLSPGRISNRICSLRRRLGVDLVPYRRQFGRNNTS